MSRRQRRTVRVALETHDAIMLGYLVQAASEDLATTDNTGDDDKEQQEHAGRALTRMIRALVGALRAAGVEATLTEEPAAQFRARLAARRN